MVNNKNLKSCKFKVVEETLKCIMAIGLWLFILIVMPNKFASVDYMDMTYYICLITYLCCGVCIYRIVIKQLLFTVGVYKGYYEVKRQNKT